MHQTLLEGDYIIVNKLAYGARVPITPLSLSFGNKHLFFDWLTLPYIRIPGYSTVCRNDIIVFNFPLEEGLPIDERLQYVKRCIGLPGDSVFISKGQVFINGEELKEPEKISLEKLAVAPDSYSPNIFPNSSVVKWNVDYFGPLYVPKCGDSISLTTKNVTLYKRIIEKFENNTLVNKNDSIYINGQYTQTYVFKMNYYFTLGDNRHSSIDSRFWGFVPENHLIGKASFILFSSNNTPSQKSRTFSSVD